MDENHYSNLKVNKKFYSKLKITGKNVIPTEEPSKKYKEFVNEYHKKHKCCPKCGGENHTTTLMGFTLIVGKEEEYKDLNKCQCSDCGNIHTVHDRVEKLDVPKTHELKTWPQYFNEIINGNKTFEIRKDDRGYKKGDILHLREYNQLLDEYTGNQIKKTVSYILMGGNFGLEKGYVIMGLKDM
jgi:hypothetical protein